MGLYLPRRRAVAAFTGLAPFSWLPGLESGVTILGAWDFVTGYVASGTSILSFMRDETGAGYANDGYLEIDTTGGSWYEHEGIINGGTSLGDVWGCVEDIDFADPIWVYASWADQGGDVFGRVYPDNTDSKFYIIYESGYISLYVDDNTALDSVTSARYTVTTSCNQSVDCLAIKTASQLKLYSAGERTPETTSHTAGTMDAVTASRYPLVGAQWNRKADGYDAVNQATRFNRLLIGSGEPSADWYASIHSNGFNSLCVQDMEANGIGRVLFWGGYDPVSQVDYNQTAATWHGWVTADANDEVLADGAGYNIPGYRHYSYANGSSTKPQWNDSTNGGYLWNMFGTGWLGANHSYIIGVPFRINALPATSRTLTLFNMEANGTADDGIIAQLVLGSSSWVCRYRGSSSASYTSYTSRSDTGKWDILYLGYSGGNKYLYSSLGSAGTTHSASVPYITNNDDVPGRYLKLNYWTTGYKANVDVGPLMIIASAWSLDDLAARYGTFSPRTGYALVGGFLSEKRPRSPGGATYDEPIMPSTWQV